MALTDAEIDKMFDEYLERKAVKSSTRGRKKEKAIAPQDDDYESMDLATYSQHLNSSMSDCTELAVNEFFDMARASEKGNKLKAVGHGIKGAVGVGLVAYGIVELLSAAMGGRD